MPLKFDMRSTHHAEGVHPSVHLSIGTYEVTECLTVTRLQQLFISMFLSWQHFPIARGVCGCQRDLRAREAREKAHTLSIFFYRYSGNTISSPVFSTVRPSPKPVWPIYDCGVNGLFRSLPSCAGWSQRSECSIIPHGGIYHQVNREQRPPHSVVIYFKTCSHAG